MVGQREFMDIHDAWVRGKSISEIARQTGRAAGKEASHRRFVAIASSDPSLDTLYHRCRQPPRGGPDAAAQAI